MGPSYSQGHVQSFALACKYFASCYSHRDQNCHEGHVPGAAPLGRSLRSPRKYPLDRYSNPKPQQFCPAKARGSLIRCFLDMCLGAWP